MALALNNKLSVIDATKTILTLHQTGTDGNKAGEENKDRQFNLKLIGKFNITYGTASHAQFYTERGHGDEKIELWQRPTREKVKLIKYKS